MINEKRIAKSMRLATLILGIGIFFSATGWGDEESRLDEVQMGFYSNVLRFPSGSVTYSIQDYRQKDNLVASLGRTAKNGYVPMIQGQVDVTLSGQGKFVWDRDRFRHEERRAHLSIAGDRVVAGIVDRLETYDGHVAKNLIASYSQTVDPMKTASIDSVEGELQGRRGTIGVRKPNVGDCPLFRSLAYFCPGMIETQDYIQDSFDGHSMVIEGNRVVLIQKGSNLKVVFDPDNSFMPVEVWMGEEGVDGFFQTITYTDLNGVKFPQTEITQRWTEGKLVYTTTCSLDAYEFDKEYGDEDFDIEYPAGTEVEDILQGSAYVVEAN